MRVPRSWADPLVTPARTTMVLAGVVSLVLLALGTLLYRAAGRARQVERELQRRQALSALGEMAAVLAHEIRTPLASIKGNAQLIGEGLPGDERVSSMVEEAGRLERLVNGLLSYARPADPRRALCDPDALLARAAQLVSARAAASGISLITDPAGCGTCLEVDPDQVLQVLVNLLQNAVEAGADPRATDPVVTARARRRGARVQFEVLDRGPGLGRDRVEDVVRPFYSSKKQGTGLGLAVARQILEQHGGDLWLEAREGGGLSVTAELPCRGPSVEGSARADGQ